MFCGVAVDAWGEDSQGDDICVSENGLGVHDYDFSEAI
jgi:hypothetical protein